LPDGERKERPPKLEKVDLCPCARPMIDASFQLGRAAEAVRAMDFSAAKDLALLADTVLRRDVEKCFPTRRPRELIQRGIAYMDELRGNDAAFAIEDAARELELEANRACGIVGIQAEITKWGASVPTLTRRR
jgi:hypothetical protein